MYLRIFSLLLAFLFLATPFQASARDCPSRLAGHLYEVNDKLSIGAELRGFYVGASIGDNMPTSALKNPFEHNGLFALKPRAEFFFNDDLSAIAEVSFRFAFPGWESNPIQHFTPRLNEVRLNYEHKGLILSAGLQTFLFGTTGLIDQRFIGLKAGYRKRKYGIELFAGTTSRMFMKNTVNCLWMRYVSYNNAWKTLAPTFTNIATGTILTWKPIRHYRFQFLYLLSYPNVEPLRSHSFSFYARGPIVRRRLSFRFEAMGYLDHTLYFMPAFVAMLNIHLTKGRLSPKIHLGVASTFLGTGDHHFSPVYENLAWGLMQRYSLHHGSIGFARLSWIPKRSHKLKIKLFADYFAQSYSFKKHDTSDELDVGVKFTINNLYDIKLAYVGLNLAPAPKPSHFAYLEVRILFGS